jgi:tRNA 2-selenouridine synthase
MVIELPLEVRLQRLVHDYGVQQTEGLEQAITNIKRRLGNEQWKNAIDALHAKNFTEVARITLYYYDKSYEKALAMKETKEVWRYTFDANDMEAIAQTLIEQAVQKGL